jgi:hypothetical protein
MHRKHLVAPYARATEYSRRAQYRGRSMARASPRLETFIAGMCGPRTEHVESCREHKSSSSMIPPFEMATLDEMILSCPVLIANRPLLPKYQI